MGFSNKLFSFFGCHASRHRVSLPTSHEITPITPMKFLPPFLAILATLCIAALAFLVCGMLSAGILAAVAFPPFAFLFASIGLSVAGAVAMAFIELPGFLREMLA